MHLHCYCGFFYDNNNGRPQMQLELVCVSSYFLWLFPMFNKWWTFLLSFPILVNDLTHNLFLISCENNNITTKLCLGMSTRHFLGLLVVNSPWISYSFKTCTSCSNYVCFSSLYMFLNIVVNKFFSSNYSHWIALLKCL